MLLYLHACMHWLVKIMMDWNYFILHGESWGLDLPLQFLFLPLHIPLLGCHIFHSIAEGGAAPNSRTCRTGGCDRHGKSIPKEWKEPSVPCCDPEKQIPNEVKAIYDPHQQVEKAMFLAQPVNTNSSYLISVRCHLFPRHLKCHPFELVPLHGNRFYK